MGKEKGFFDKKPNKIAVFISLFVALILFLINIVIWFIKFIVTQIFKVSGYESELFIYGLGAIITVLLLFIFIKKFSTGLDL